MPALLEGAVKLDGNPADAESLLTSVVSGDSGDFLNALLLPEKQTGHRGPPAEISEGSRDGRGSGGDSSLFTVNEICLVRIKAGRVAEEGAPRKPGIGAPAQAPSTSRSHKLARLNSDPGADWCMATCRREWS